MSSLDSSDGCVMVFEEDRDAVLQSGAPLNTESERETQPCLVAHLFQRYRQALKS